MNKVKIPTKIFNDIKRNRKSNNYKEDKLERSNN